MIYWKTGSVYQGAVRGTSDEYPILHGFGVWTNSDRTITKQGEWVEGKFKDDGQYYALYGPD